MFIAERYHGPRPFKLVRWELAEHFHWTLEYIDSLSMADLAEWAQILDGRATAAGMEQ